MSFENFGLHDAIIKAVKTSGYTEPTSVQAQAIPALLSGADLMVSAATGSGKTAAFMLPALHKLTMESPVRSIGPRVLVLTPTRELALQVTKAAETYGKFLKRTRVVSVVGGMPYPAQIRLLKQPLEVLVATPGRLLDYIERGRIDFSRLELLVLDEADRMLDMGFIEDIEAIAEALPAERQTVMFSATFGGAVGKLAAGMMKDAQRIELANSQDTHENIEQRLHFADDDRHKSRLLDHLLRGEGVDQTIVFAATKRDTEFLADHLAANGFAAAPLHGDMPQAKRNRTLTGLRRGEIKILVATDVAARGIDVPSISHVINYGMPMRAEDYVHRIGRTGRAGRNGVAITIAGPAERGKVRAIERFTTQRIAVHEIAGLEPKLKPESRPRFDRDRRGGFGGKPRFEERPFAPREERGFAPREARGEQGRSFGSGERRFDEARREPRSEFRPEGRGERRDWQGAGGRPAGGFGGGREQGFETRRSFAKPGEEGARSAPRQAGERPYGERREGRSFSGEARPQGGYNERGRSEGFGGEGRRSFGERPAFSDRPAPRRDDTRAPRPSVGREESWGQRPQRAAGDRPRSFQSEAGQQAPRRRFTRD